MAELEKDWLGRKASDAFSFYDKKKKLISWEKTLEENEALSSYFMKGADPGKDAAKMLGSMFRVLGVDPLTKYTTKNEVDPKKIKIPMHMVYDEDTNTFTEDRHQIDNFFGSALQTAALSGLQSKEAYKSTLKTMYNSEKKNTLMNMLETALRLESIDTKIAEKAPGYAKFVQKYKKDLFENNYEKPDEFASANARLMDTVVRMLRFPATVTEEEVKEFEKPLKTLQTSVKRRGGLPETDSEIKSFTRMLYKLIVDYEEEEPELPGGGGGEGEGEDEEEGGMPPAGGGSPSKSKEEKEEELEEMAKKMMESMTSSEESEMDSEDFEEFESTMKGDPKHSYEEEKTAYTKPLEFIVSDTDESQYKSDALKVDRVKAKVLATLFRRKSKDHGFVVKSMKSGRFDTSKLVEASQGVPNVYERMGHITTDKICIGVLIDESGSMGCSRKIQKAREAAIFINEVFGKLGDVELFIYGHTADESSYSGRSASTTVRIYREPGTQMNPYALGSVEARSNNRDGDAIYATARRIRSKTKRNGILFVISDGQPAASEYGGKASIEDVRKKVIKSEKLGFQVIQIAIESHVPSHEMFKNFVKMTDIATLPGDLVRYMSRRMNMIMKEHISY
jgi:Mg-chelatase subunit ChlD